MPHHPDIRLGRGVRAAVCHQRPAAGARVPGSAALFASAAIIPVEAGPDGPLLADCRTNPQFRRSLRDAYAIDERRSSPTFGERSKVARVLACTAFTTSGGIHHHDVGVAFQLQPAVQHARLAAYQWRLATVSVTASRLFSPGVPTAEIGLGLAGGEGVADVMF